MHYQDLKKIIKSDQKKYINYIERYRIPSNVYDGIFMQNYQLAAFICKLNN